MRLGTSHKKDVTSVSVGGYKPTSGVYIERFFVYSLCMLMLWHSLKPFKGTQVSQIRAQSGFVAEQSVCDVECRCSGHSLTCS